MSTNYNLYKGKALSPKWTSSLCPSQEDRHHATLLKYRHPNQSPYHRECPHLGQGSHRLKQTHVNLVFKLAETSKLVEQLISVTTRIRSPCQASREVRMDRVFRTELLLESKKLILRLCSLLKRNYLLLIHSLVHL